MIQLLRIFPKFRELEESLERAESAKIRLEDDIRFWRSRADWAEADRDRARLDLAGALKAISNWQAMMTGAPAVPFPEIHAAHQERAAAEFSPQQPQRRSMRDLQQEAVAKSRHAAFERRQAHVQES